jgi:hypothetical protein
VESGCFVDIFILFADDMEIPMRAAGWQFWRMSILHITEPARKTPVCHEADVCVLGGSCTGLFAAVRAARLGARVIIVEKENCFGGVATTALVNVWHSFWDTAGRRQIIAGLSQEVVERLERRGALLRRAVTDPSVGFAFNSEELKIELDELAREARLTVLFHTQFVAPHVEEGRLAAVLVENKSGRSAIRASYFIDATGDGDLAARLGCPVRTSAMPQPATACVRFSGWETLRSGEGGEEGGGDRKVNVGAVLREHGAACGVPAGFVWGSDVPGAATHMLAGTRIGGIDPTDAGDLTRAEMEGRRQIRVIHDLLRQAAPGARLAIEALPSRLGLRESRHVGCAYSLSGDDVLRGRVFDDAVALGSYRVDIHHHDRPGITLRYLDGTETYSVPGRPQVRGRWRPESESAGENPVFYRIPWRALLPRGGYGNLVVAGRMLDADPVAYGAVRVMVNLNQTGEAAGVAAALALEAGAGFPQVDAARLRAALRRGGSALA